MFYSYLEQYGALVTFRNLVFAPLTEEVVFRAVMIPSMYLAAWVAATDANPVNSFQIALVSPVWFGLAHLHHFLDKMRLKVPLSQNLTVTLIQLIYTSIFGLVAALLFMRTGNITAPVLSHVLCNLLGLPDLGFMHSTTNKQLSNEYSCLYTYRYLLLFMHAVGLVAFSFALFPLTDSMVPHSPYWR